MIPGPSRRTWRAALIHGALLAGGLAIWFFPLFATGGVRLPGGPIDPRHLNWVLEWHHLCATGNGLCEGWLSPPIFSPIRQTLAATDLLLGQMVFYLPARLSGLAPDLAQQATVALLLVLAYAASVWLSTRVLGASHGASAIGAFVFAFAAPRTAQVNHPQLAAFFALPLIVGGIALGIGSPARAPRSGGWLLAGSAFAYQFYASANIAWLFLFWLGLVAAAALFTPACRASLGVAIRRDLVPISAAGALFLAVAVPLALLYAKARDQFGAATDFAVQVAPLLPRPVSWLRQGEGSLEGALLPGLGSDLPSEWEHALGAGWITTLLCLLGAVVVRRAPWSRAMAVATGATIGLVTSWPGGFEPWQAVHAIVPGAESVRAAGRIVLILLLPASLALVALASEARRRRTSAAIVSACALLVIVEQIREVASRPRRVQQTRVERLVAAIPEQCELFYSSTEVRPDTNQRQHVDAMWAALATGKPTLNGYTSYPPPGWPLWRSSPSSSQEVEWLREGLRSWIADQGIEARSTCWVREREFSGPRGNVEVGLLSEPAPGPSAPVLP